VYVNLVNIYIRTFNRRAYVKILNRVSPVNTKAVLNHTHIQAHYPAPHRLKLVIAQRIQDSGKLWSNL